VGDRPGVDSVNPNDARMVATSTRGDESKRVAAKVPFGRREILRTAAASCCRPCRRRENGVTVDEVRSLSPNSVVPAKKLPPEITHTTELASVRHPVTVFKTKGRVHDGGNPASPSRNLAQRYLVERIFQVLPAAIFGADFARRRPK